MVVRIIAFDSETEPLDFRLVCFKHRNVIVWQRNDVAVEVDPHVAVVQARRKASDVGRVGLGLVAGVKGRADTVSLTSSTNLTERGAWFVDLRPSPRCGCAARVVASEGIESLQCGGMLWSLQVSIARLFGWIFGAR